MALSRVLRPLLLALLVVTLTAGHADAGKKKRKKKRKARKAAVPALAVELENQLWSLLEPGTRSGDIPARGLAVEAITYLRPSESLKYAIESLQDPQWKVRAGAIRALVRMGNKAYEKPLQDAIARGRGLAQEVYPVLATVPEKTALGILFSVLDAPKVPNKDRIVGALVDHGGPLAKAAFERALAGKGAPHPVFKAQVSKLPANRPALLEAAARSRSTDVLQAVIARARSFGEKTPLDFVKPLLSAKDRTVALAAAELLAARGDTAAVPVLLSLLDGEAPSAENRKRAFTALAGVATPKAVQVAVETFENNDPPPRPQLEVEVDLLFALCANARDQRLLPLMQSYVTGTDAKLRAIAVPYLGKVQGPRALPRLHELLFDGNPVVRESAARAIADVAQSESIPHLRRALDDRVPPVRRAVAAAFGAIHDKAVVDVVSFLVSDPDREVRLGAARALANANHSSALPSLRIVLRDRDPEVRLAAFRGMMRVDPKAAEASWASVLRGIQPGSITSLAGEFAAVFLPFIETAANSPKEPVRADAMVAARKLGKTERLGMVARLLKDAKNLDVRLTALDMLVEEQGAAALPMVQDLSGDTDAGMRRAAIQKLAKLGTRDNIPALQGYLADADEGIRLLSAVAILEIHFRQ